MKALDKYNRILDGYFLFVCLFGFNVAFNNFSVISSRI